jgi:hypothetical protein
MKPILKRIKAIERRMPPEPEVIKYTTMSPGVVDKLESIIGKKLTAAEKRIPVSDKPLSPVIIALIERITNRVVQA